MRAIVFLIAAASVVGQASSGPLLKAGSLRATDDIPELFRSVPESTPAEAARATMRAYSKEPGVVDTRLIQLDRSALRGEVMALDLFGKPVTLHEIARRTIEGAGGTVRDCLIGHRLDGATLQVRPDEGHSGTIVIRKRNWEVISLGGSAVALATYAPRPATPAHSKEPGSTARDQEGATPFYGKSDPDRIREMFPRLFEPGRGTGAHGPIIESIRARPTVEQVDVLSPGGTPLRPNSKGFELSLPNHGAVLLLRIEAVMHEPDGAFVWNAAVIRQATDSASLVVTPRGCSGSLNLDGTPYEIRAVGGDMHVLLRLDTTQFPPDESDED